MAGALSGRAERATAGISASAVDAGRTARVRPVKPIIAPSSLGPANVGEPYARKLSVRGSAQYSLRVTKGQLPPGIAVSREGTLSGMATEPGTWAFTISAFSRRDGYVAFRDYRLTVRVVGPPPFFADDFEGGLGRWNKEGTPEAFSVVDGWSGQGAAITAGPTTTGPANGQSQLASLWLDWPAAHATNGKSTWYAAKVMFPTSYEATTGQWNWFIVWHIDDATSGVSGHELAGARDLHRLPGRPQPRPQPAARVPRQRWVGDPASDEGVHDAFQHPRAGTVVRHPRAFRLVTERRDRPGGAVDRRSPARRHELPTLYSLPNGETSYGYFGLYNYRLRASWSAAVLFDRVRIGPTLSSLFVD